MQRNQYVGIINEIDTSDESFNFLTITVDSKIMRVYVVKAHTSGYQVGQRVQFRTSQNDGTYKGATFAPICTTRFRSD